MCCHEFREQETEYLKKVISAAENEYKADGVKYRLVIVHNPFSYTINPPFDIEQPLFSEWLKLLGDSVKPQLMVSGHLHSIEISPVGGQLDSKGQICPVIVGSVDARDPDTNEASFVGCAITLSDGKAYVRFTNSAHKVVAQHILDL